MQNLIKNSLSARKKVFGFKVFLWISVLLVSQIVPAFAEEEQPAELLRSSSPVDIQKPRDVRSCELLVEAYEAGERSKLSRQAAEAHKLKADLDRLRKDTNSGPFREQIGRCHQTTRNEDGFFECVDKILNASAPVKANFKPRKKNGT